MNLKSSIDIGTNSVLLLVCEMENGIINVLHEKQSVPRLGKGVDVEKKLHPESCKRVMNVLRDYRQFLNSIESGLAEYAVVTATSAVRDAGNRDDFIKLVKKETGWDIRLLSGAEEAQITYIGGLSVLEHRQSNGNLVIDIGGGSTEISYGKGYKLIQANSVDMGSVRFTERLFKNDPPSPHEIQNARSEIRKLLLSLEKPHGDFDVIGVAGTVTSLAAIHYNLTDYNTNHLNSSILRRDTLNNSIDEFSKMQYLTIENKYPEFMTGRGEVILAGALILDEILSWCGRDFCLVSTGGIRHGIILNG
ncbi:MAG: Ppx/GppA family phosphatase [Balneolaceae bacterium]|nr:MAG: Ppx/GppA family phosphatase [Balneolaceae bacterium]